MDRPDLLILTPYVDPPPGGIQRLALDILAAYGDKNVRLLAVSAQPRSDPRIRIVRLREGPIGSVVTAAAFALATFGELRRRPRMVQAMTWRAAVPLLFWRGAPTALYAHGAELIRNWNGLGERVVRARVLRRVTGIVANSRFTQGLTQEVINRTPAVVNPPIEKLPDVTADVTKSSAVTVVSVGRLVPDKGMDRLIRAVAALRAGGIDASLRIAGTGPEEASLHALIDQLGLRAHVELLGRIPDAELDALYQSADIFALLSVATNDEVEGFGIVYMEAAAFGLPVVAGGVGGIADAVEDGVTGFLTHSHEEEVAALTKLASDPPLRAACGNAGRARAGQFLLPQFREQLDAFYGECERAFAMGARL